MVSGLNRLRPSNTSGVCIRFLTSAKSWLANSFHSVAIRSASAPSAASAGVAASVFSEVGTPEALAKVPEFQAMQERKRQEVAAAQQAAMQQAEHGYVLGWDLAG